MLVEAFGVVGGEGVLFGADQLARAALAQSQCSGILVVVKALVITGTWALESTADTRS